MAEIRWTEQAADDLDAAAAYIARDSPHYASLFCIKLLSRVDLLQKNPALGRIVPEVGDPAIRELLFGSYRIIYRIKDDTVELLSIYHGARLLDPDRLTLAR